MGEYLDNLWNDLEKTWQLSMKLNDFRKVIVATQLKLTDISRRLISLMPPEQSQK